MIRMIIVILFVVLYLITVLPYLGIEWILGRCFRSSQSSSRSDMMWNAFRHSTTTRRRRTIIST